ncbi:MAG: DUF4330 domain-containing protein [Oscillospiraceae bacterium]|nr:DUF4330 domain-containing protein [Oscillospiraceae bacterium]
MKIIDEKGRLFGKVNLIDLAVILVIVLAAAALIWKLGGDKAAAAITAEPTRVNYTVLCQDVPTEVCEFAETQIGKNLVNSGKVLDAQLVETSFAATDEEGLQNLYLTVDGAASFAGEVYTVGPQDVRVGYEYIFKTSEFELTGIVSDMEVTHG